MTAHSNTAPAQIAALQASVNQARTDLNNAQALIPDNPYGVYRPLFADASTGLTSPSGLAVASGGGLIASVAGAAGTAYIDLPATIDYTKPWRLAALIQCDSASDANYARVYLGSAPSQSNPDFHGLLCDITSGFITIQTGSNNAGYQIMPTLGSGAKYWVGAASDGVSVSVFCMPYSHGGLFTANLSNTGQFDWTRRYDYNATGFGGLEQFRYMSRIKIDTKSVNTRILGVFANTGGEFEASGAVVSPTGYAGGTDSRMKPPSMQQPVYDGTYDGALIRVPKAYDGRTPIDLVYCDHPNGSDEWAQSRYVDTDTGTAVASLVNAGYMVAYRNGAPFIYSGALNSPWGGPTGLAKRKAMIDDIKARLPMVRHVYWLGLSMGCLDGLIMHQTYPTLLRALIGISGVTNLTWSHDTGGFSSVISTGWAAADWTSVIKPNDPHLNASKFASLPMAIWHSTGDTTVDKTNNCDAFKTLVEAQGGSVTIHPVTGTGHLTDVGLFDGSAIQTFLAAN